MRAQAQDQMSEQKMDVMREVEEAESKGTLAANSIRSRSRRARAWATALAVLGPSLCSPLLVSSQLVLL